MSVIQAAWKAEVGGSWSKRVEKTVRHYLKKIIKAKKGWVCDSNSQSERGLA
jgi:hypothetical protein